MFLYLRTHNMHHNGETGNAGMGINGLRRRTETGYIHRAAAKSVAGRGNPCNLLAISDAASVFFCIAALAHQHSAALARTESMVAQAGHPKGWPVSSRAGISTPVWATSNHERGNSGGSKYSYLLEVALWLLPLTRHTLTISGFSLPCAVLTRAINLTAERLRLLIIRRPENFLPVTMWPLLPAVYRHGNADKTHTPGLRALNDFLYPISMEAYAHA